MTITALMPVPKQQYIGVAGLPLVGGKVYTYAAGTNNPKATYTDAAATVPQPNPIPLNARGEPANAIFWSGAYKVEVRDALNNVLYTVDNYSTDPAGILDSLAQFAKNVGASLIGFIQAGAGAILRTVQDKLRETVSVKDFGAVGDGATDDTAAIQKAKTYAESLNKTLWFPSGTYLCGSTITLNPNTTIRGDGQSTTIIKFTGTANMQSARASATDDVDVRDITLQQGGTAPIGLDIGTLRQSTLQNMGVREFLIGVNLDIGVNLVANYWNRLINIEAAGPGKTVANSVGFNLGNNVNVTYPDTDYNMMIGCKSFTCETGVRALNAIGCQILSHQCTEVTRGLSFFNGNNCHIEMMVENSTNMGFADINTRANKFYMYNDGGNATAFLDNGWNYVEGQILGFPTFSSPIKRGDSFVEDRVFYGGVALSVPMFQLNMSAAEGVATVALRYTGYLAGKLEISGVAVWDVFKVGAGSTPKPVLQRMVGPSGGTASFAGTVMTVQSGTFSVGQTITGAGIPTGTKITSFVFGGGGVGTNANISNDVGTLGTRPVSATETIFSVAATADGLVTWTAAGDAAALLVLNTVVEIQGISGLQAYPYSQITQYKRLV